MACNDRQGTEFEAPISRQMCKDISSEPCDECSMKWQPMSKEDVLTSLVQDLIEELWEYAGDARYSKDTIELLHRAEEEVYEWAKSG